MIDWVREHPYLSAALTLGLIILFFVIRGRASAVQPAPGYAPAPVVSDAIQQAGIAAGVATQQIQAASNEQNNSLQAQLAALQLHEGTTLQIAQLEQQAELQKTLTGGQVASQQSSDQLSAALAATGAAVTVNESNNQTAVKLAGIQAPLVDEQIRASLALGLNTNLTSEQIAKLQADAGVAIAQSHDTAATMIAGGADATALGIAQAQWDAAVKIAGGADATTVDLAALEAGVQNNLINTTGKVQVAGLNLIQTGVLNKGGEGGVNQVSAFGSVFGNPGAGFAPAIVGSAQASGGNTPGGIINSIANLVKSVPAAVFGGAPGGGATPTRTVNV